MIEVPAYTHSGIYAIHNETRGLWYIGSSYNIRQRAKNHKAKLERGIHSNQALQASYNAGDVLTFSIIRKMGNASTYDVLEAEKQEIRAHDSFVNGYNQRIPHEWTDKIEGAS